MHLNLCWFKRFPLVPILNTGTLILNHRIFKRNSVETVRFDWDTGNQTKTGLNWLKASPLVCLVVQARSGVRRMYCRSSGIVEPLSGTEVRNRESAD